MSVEDRVERVVAELSNLGQVFPSNEPVNLGRMTATLQTLFAEAGASDSSVVRLPTDLALLYDRLGGLYTSDVILGWSFRFFGWDHDHSTFQPFHEADEPEEVRSQFERHGLWICCARARDHHLAYVCIDSSRSSFGAVSYDPDDMVYEDLTFRVSHRSTLEWLEGLVASYHERDR